jgi:hypothetical protein
VENKKQFLHLVYLVLDQKNTVNIIEKQHMKEKLVKKLNGINQ